MFKKNVSSWKSPLTSVIWSKQICLNQWSYSVIKTLFHFLKSGLILASFCSFRLFYMTQIKSKLIKVLMVCWYLNPGQHDGRRRWIPWAMVAPLSYLGRQQKFTQFLSKVRGHFSFSFLFYRGRKSQICCSLKPEHILATSSTEIVWSEHWWHLWRWRRYQWMTPIPNNVFENIFLQRLSLM